MVSLAADYGEHALGRRMAEYASRNRRAVDEPVVIVYGDALVSDRNNSIQRPLAVIDFGALRPGAEGAPPIFELLWPYALRAVQGWSLSYDEE
jgi:aminoglycoside phosphotransferase (APT) family kinase protein